MIGNTYHIYRLPWWFSGKEPACQCRTCAFDPWVRNILEKELATHSSKGNLMDRGAWQATVHGVSKRWTQLNHPTTHTHTHAYDCCLVTKSPLILCNPMVRSLSGSSVHGILQARILEWVAISISRGASQPRDWTWVSYIAGDLLYHCGLILYQLSYQGSPVCVRVCVWVCLYIFIFLHIWRHGL